MPCERCRRLTLQCKIEQNFKRVGKRSKNAEMEREIIELRKRVASQDSSPTTPSVPRLTSTSASPSMSQLPSTLDQYMGSQEAVSTLMDLRSGLEGGSFMRSPNGQILPSRRLEDVLLTHDRVRDLFQQYVITHWLPSEIAFNKAEQLLHSVPSFSPIAGSRKVSRRLLRCIFSSLLGHDYHGCTALWSGSSPIERFIWARNALALGKRSRCSPKLHCRESIVYNLHLALTCQQYFIRSYIHAEWSNDPSIATDRSTSAFPCSGLHQVQD